MGGDGRFRRLVWTQSAAYFLIFTAFNAAQNLAGSLPGPEGLAAMEFTALYVAFTVLCVPAPTIVACLGPKVSMIVGAVPYAGVLLSHLAPSACSLKKPGGGGGAALCWSVDAVWAFNITVGVLCGAGAALIWTGQGVYLSRAAAHAAAAAAQDGAPLDDNGDNVNDENNDAEDPADGEDASLLASSSTNGGSAGTVVAPARSGGGDGSSGGGDGDYDALVQKPRPSRTAPSFARRVGVYNKRFNSIFFSLLQFSGATGTLIAFLVLEFVPGVTHALQMLFLVLGGCCVCGILVILCCLPNLNALGAGGDDDGRAGAASAAAAAPGLLDTIKLWRDPRLRYLIPVIFYNGASLGFLWQTFNVLAWDKAVGLSFVGLGSAFWFLVNTVFSPILGRVAERIGYLTVMLSAATAQVLFFVLLLLFPIAPLACLSSGCANNTAGPCWKLAVENTSAVDPPFPAGCGTASSDPTCAICAPYDVAGGNKCGAEWFQCEWLGSPGDADAPAVHTMVLLFAASALHAIGDSVWETQLPAVLQTIFTDDGDKAAAMANLKMWQSLGVSVLFAMSFGCSLELQSFVQLALLVVAASLIYFEHLHVVDLDSGERRGA